MSQKSKKRNNNEITSRLNKLYAQGIDQRAILDVINKNVIGSQDSTASLLNHGIRSLQHSNSVLAHNYKEHVNGLSKDLAKRTDGLSKDLQNIRRAQLVNIAEQEQKDHGLRQQKMLKALAIGGGAGLGYWLDRRNRLRGLLIGGLTGYLAHSAYEYLK